MIPLKRIRYHTMNSCNLSTAPAYNLKIYNVINRELQKKVFELMQAENFYENINLLIQGFNKYFNYEWQASFNGRSGGYLVLYRGGVKDNRIFSCPGKSIDNNEVPSEVLKAFKQLAINIVQDTEYKAKHCKIKNEEYTITRKIVEEE